MANLIKFFSQFTDKELEIIQKMGKELFLSQNKGWDIDELNEEIDLNFSSQIPTSWKKRREVGKTVVLFNLTRTVGMSDSEVDELLLKFKTFVNQ